MAAAVDMHKAILSNVENAIRTTQEEYDKQVKEDPKKIDKNFEYKDFDPYYSSLSNYKCAIINDTFKNIYSIPAKYQDETETKKVKTTIFERIFKGYKSTKEISRVVHHTLNITVPELKSFKTPDIEWLDRINNIVVLISIGNPYGIAADGALFSSCSGFVYGFEYNDLTGEGKLVGSSLMLVISDYYYDTVKRKILPYNIDQDNDKKYNKSRYDEVTYKNSYATLVHELQHLHDHYILRKRQQSVKDWNTNHNDKPQRNIPADQYFNPQLTNDSQRAVKKLIYMCNDTELNAFRTGFYASANQYVTESVWRNKVIDNAAAHSLFKEIIENEVPTTALNEFLSTDPETIIKNLGSNYIQTVFNSSYFKQIANTKKYKDIASTDIGKVKIMKKVFKVKLSKFINDLSKIWVSVVNEHNEEIKPAKKMVRESFENSFDDNIEDYTDVAAANDIQHKEEYIKKLATEAYNALMDEIYEEDPIGPYEEDCLIAARDAYNLIYKSDICKPIKSLPEEYFNFFAKYLIMELAKDVVYDWSIGSDEFDAYAAIQFICQCTSFYGTKPQHAFYSLWQPQFNDGNGEGDIDDSDDNPITFMVRQLWDKIYYNHGVHDYTVYESYSYPSVMNSGGHTNSLNLMGYEYAILPVTKVLEQKPNQKKADYQYIHVGTKVKAYGSIDDSKSYTGYIQKILKDENGVIKTVYILDEETRKLKKASPDRIKMVSYYNPNKNFKHNDNQR